MNGEALGLIETVGLVAAVTAADTCLKSANVSLVGYELTRGFGLVTVKISGDVSAVTAAISSAKVSASLVGKVYSTLIIPRPSGSTDNLISTKETVGIEQQAEVEEIADKEIVADSKEVQIDQYEINEKNNSDIDVVTSIKDNLQITDIANNEAENKENEIFNDEEINSEIMENTEKNDEDIKTDKIENTDKKVENINLDIIEDTYKNNEDVKQVQEICNICGDPKCPRKKGMPRKLCIHYK